MANGSAETRLGEEPATPESEVAHEARRSGWMPIYLAAALGFAFVIGFADRADPPVARITLALGSAAMAMAIMLLGQTLLTLRGRKRFQFLEELPTHEALGQDKARVLAALKEIEFDHAMGKLNERDYRDMKTRYEAEAMQVFKAIDAERERWRQRAESVMGAHLKKAGVSAAPVGTGTAAPAKPSPKAASKKASASPVSDKTSEAASTAPSAPETTAEATSTASPVPETTADHASIAPSAPKETSGGAPKEKTADEKTACRNCETMNDTSARFCKRCGKSMDAGPPTCTGCQTPNDPDARFCKSCGKTLGEAA